MTEVGFYNAPESDLGVDVAQKKTFGLFKRFYITFLWGLPVYMFFVVLGIPKNMWFMGGIGSMAFSFGSGVVAMLIPVQRKSVFVTISLIFGVLTATFLGISAG